MEGLLVPMSRRRTTKLTLRIAQTASEISVTLANPRDSTMYGFIFGSEEERDEWVAKVEETKYALATLALQSPWVGWFKYSPRRAQERVHAQLGDWLECRASGHVAGSAQQQQHGILHQLDRTRVLGGQDLSRTSDRLPLFINRSNHCNTFRLRRHLLSILRRSKPRSSSDTVSSMIFTPRFVVNLLSRSLSLSLSLN